MTKFVPRASFEASSYSLLPFRFRRLPWDAERALVTSLSGDWIVLERGLLDRLVNGTLDAASPLIADLAARHLVVTDLERSTLAPLLAQMRQRKAYLHCGPNLHLFVVSLRCHHTCAYCQVSRQPEAAAAYDMSDATADAAVERLFEWPASEMTIEFQGGEPLLHFERVRDLVERITRRNRVHHKSLRFVVASTLHDLTEEHLAFFREFRFQLSTSLDGPEWLHNKNRPRPGGDSYRRTVEGIERGRRALGEGCVSALTTLTRASLEVPDAIIEAYRSLGLHSIFLRPLSPYGFARKTQARQGYAMADFVRFYAVALEHLLRVNREGFALDEVYAGLLLSQLLTPFDHGYVDLRSPTGAGFGAIVYDYDGTTYPSDEARMLAAMGDRRFALGSVHQPVADWLNSSAMTAIAHDGIAEALATCADCAYVPWCGADPIDHYARQGDTYGHRPTSAFCERQMGMYDLLLHRYESANMVDRAVLDRWGIRRHATSPVAEVA